MYAAEINFFIEDTETSFLFFEFTKELEKKKRDERKVNFITLLLLV